MIEGDLLTPPIIGQTTNLPTPRPGLDGDDGWSVQLGRNETHLLVRQVRGDVVTAWVEVIAIAEMVGPPGAVPVFDIVGGALAYRFGSSGPWAQLFTLASLRGDRGLSAHEVWLGAGNTGTVADFLASLRGLPGAASTVPGPPGDPGPQGAGGTPNVDLVGTGVPNGSATAQPGTIYKDLAKTYGVRLWIKDTGTSNQGWVPLLGDTGVRDITSLQDPQFMTIATSKVTTQRFYNGNVTLAARCSAPTNPSGNFTPRIYLPTGFWPEASVNTLPGESVLGSARALASTAPTGFQWNWYIASGALRGFSTTAPVPMGGGFIAYATYACSQPPPTI